MTKGIWKFQTGWQNGLHWKKCGLLRDVHAEKLHSTPITVGQTRASG
jgi:hypothetical protein